MKEDNNNENMLGTKYSTLLDIVGDLKPVGIDKVKLCLELLSVANAIDKTCADKLSYYKLSESRFLLLSILSKHKSLSPQELTHLSGVSKATMTQLITTLHKDNFIEKKLLPEDGRSYSITLTSHGEEIIDEIFSAHIYWIESITLGLDKKEIASLRNILRIVFSNLEK
jgi:DNA-binding MarR family transcriptional regulator